jgi:hypothetical protein
MTPLGNTGFALCFWYEIDHRLTREQALQHLRRSQSDIWVQGALRHLVDQRFGGAAMTRLSDEAILEAVAGLMASGELVLVQTNDRAVGNTIFGATAKSTAPPPPAPRAATQAPAPPPPQDPSIFPPGVDLVAQAAMNQAAAQQGAPFCPQ